MGPSLVLYYWCTHLQEEGQRSPIEGQSSPTTTFLFSTAVTINLKVNIYRGGKMGRFRGPSFNRKQCKEVLTQGKSQKTANLIALSVEVASAQWLTIDISQTGGQCYIPVQQRNGNRNRNQKGWDIIYQGGYDIYQLLLMDSSLVSQILDLDNQPLL